MTKYERFWNWFKANEELLFESVDEFCDGIEIPIWKTVSDKLHELHPHLGFLVGSAENNRRELVITAGSDRKALPDVVRLFEDVPLLPRWKLTKLRPRRSGDWRFSYEGVPLDLEDVEFVLLIKNERINLAVFVRGYARAAENECFFLEAIPQMVDDLLGEEDAMWLEEIVVFPWDDPIIAKRHPIRLLALAFDQMKQQLPGIPT